LEQVTLPGDPPIEVMLKSSPRARRLSLRVSRLDGRVTLTLPQGASRRQALAFAREKEDWVRRNLADRPQDIHPQPGDQVPFGGRPHMLVDSGGRAARLGEDVIHLPQGSPEKTGARLAALFKHHARRNLHKASAGYAARAQRQVGRITLRDTRSRWGSCSHEGNLMFSWRLIMAPPEVLDYVAAHEVAHLVEMNHSPAYWAVVEHLCPQYRGPRMWLRQNGALLHRYRFRD